MKFYEEGSWVSQPIKQIALRDFRPYLEYKNSKVMKTKLQLAREIIRWDKEHFPDKQKLIFYLTNILLIFTFS